MGGRLGPGPWGRKGKQALRRGEFSQGHWVTEVGHRERELLGAGFCWKDWIPGAQHSRLREVHRIRDPPCGVLGFNGTKTMWSKHHECSGEQPLRSSLEGPPSIHPSIQSIGDQPDTPSVCPMPRQPWSVRVWGGSPGSSSSPPLLLFSSHCKDQFIFTVRSPEIIVNTLASLFLRLCAFPSEHR